MKFHVARQPIFTQNLQAYGYELLYRRMDTENYFNPLATPNGDEATSSVIINSFHNIGLDKLTGGKKAFVNFTGNFLAQQIATLFPRDALVVEILESVVASKDVIERCMELKRLGYTLALDDYVMLPENVDLLPLADIVKVDFMQSGEEEIARMCRVVRPTTHLLAEKIETREMYETAVKMGFRLFQGYFFAKPKIISGEAPRPISVHSLELLRLVNKPDFSFRRVAQVIMRDVSLSYQLLRLVNSVVFGFTTEIRTIHHALVALGQNEVRKWVSLVSMMGMSEDQPRELHRISLTRAKFCEQLGSTNGQVDSCDVFMAGLFSLIDVMMNRSFEEIFFSISASEELRATFVEGTGIYRPYIDVVIAYERGDWEKVDELAVGLGMHADGIADAYTQALQWTNELIPPGG